MDITILVGKFSLTVAQNFVGRTLVFNKICPSPGKRFTRRRVGRSQKEEWIHYRFGKASNEKKKDTVIVGYVFF